MIGVLLQVALQGPFSASSSACLDGIVDSTNTSNTSIITDSTNVDQNVLTLWDQQKYFFFAIIIATIFISAQSMLLVFVPEKNGNLIRRIFYFNILKF